MVVRRRYLQQQIKRVSPDKRTSETFVGTGENGMRDGQRATFDEPAGVSVAFAKLYVADTNNHLIRVVDLKTRQVETLQIKGLDKLRSRRSKRFAGEILELPAQTVEPGDTTLTLQLELPPGYKLNLQAPSALTVASLAGGAEQTVRNPQFPVSIPIKLSEADATIRVDYIVYYCEAEKESLCYFKEARLNLPVVVKPGAGNRVLSATYKLR